MAAMLIWWLMRAEADEARRKEEEAKKNKLLEEQSKPKPDDMKETIDNLFKDSEELLEKCNDLTKAMDALRNVRPSETALIDDMTTEYNSYVERRHKVLDAITALQNVCKHEKWEYTGHDSHYSYEKCVVCRLERKT